MRLFSAGENRRHEVPVARESGIANHVYAVMHTMKPPLPHPPIDRVIAKPQRPELSALDDSMLPPGMLRHRPVR